jgi:hypothetical protein
LSKPKIARALFISCKRVEEPTSEAYRKLDIDARDQIAGAFAPLDTAPFGTGSQP